MSTISFGGLATGLDTGSIISQLLMARSRPMHRMQSQVAHYEADKQAISVLNDYVNDLMSKVHALDSESEFASFAATSEDESIFTAIASDNAMPGNYSITVNSLATAQKDISQGYDSLTDLVGTGAIGIVVNGESTNITMPEGANTLDDLRAAINNSDAGVTASIIYDGSETGGYHLVLTASETGTDSSFNVLANLSGGTAPLFSTIETASNAEVEIDTVVVSSQTNSISDAISGITLNLLNAQPGQSAALEVQPDGEAVQTKIQEFIDAYNTLYTYMNDQKQEGATLRGDQILRTVSNRINNVMTQAMPNSEISMLYQVGIKQSEHNLLEFDSAKFQEQLSENYSGVQKLFTAGSDTFGPIYVLGFVLDDMTDSVDGVFKLSDDSIDNRIETLEKSITRYQVSLDNYEQLLSMQFAAMEQIVSGLNAQSSYLAAFTQ